MRKLYYQTCIQTLRVPAIACLLALSLCAQSPVADHAQRIENGAASGDRLRSLNNSLLRLHAELQRSPQQAEILREQAGRVIAERAAALEALMESDPAQALMLALPEEARSRIAAAFPESASWLEAHGVWQGEVEHLIEDDFIHQKHREIRRLKAGSAQLELQFADVVPAGLKSGDLVRANGVRSGQQVVATEAQIEASTLAPNSCSTKGPQKTAVLLVTFPGVTPPQGLTPAGVYDMFFGPAGRSLDGFWREASYGATSATGNVFGWYTLSQSYKCADIDLIRSAAIQAASSDVNFPEFNRLMIIFPDPTCWWAGSSSVGCSTLNSSAGSFSASTSNIIAHYLTDPGLVMKLVPHEAGHALGLLHSGARDFGTEALGPLGVTGEIREYGDPFTTMGSLNTALYAAPHKANTLRWMTEGFNYQTVRSNGIWSLQPLEVSPAGLQALKVQRGTDNDAWLWIEYRQPIGEYDSTLPNEAFSGVLIHYEDAITTRTGPRTHLLDFTPQTDSWVDAALRAGSTWVDPHTNLTISVGTANGNAATVTVNYGATPCTIATPTVALTPGNPGVDPGSTVNYTVSVTSRDSSGCSPSSFSLSSVQPQGWVTSFSQSQVTLVPGGTASLSMSMEVPSGTLPGTYLVSALASRPSMSGVGEANCTVLAKSLLSTTVSVSGASFDSRDHVPINASVLFGGGPVRASVTFTMTKPDGSVTTKNANTDSQGNTTWSYRFGPKDPPGTYSVAAQATYSGQQVSSPAATFQMK